MAEINSFSENMRRVVTTQANELERLAALQKAMTTNDAYVTVTQTDTKGESETYQMPSMSSVDVRLSSVENSISDLLSGRSTISLVDGTTRQLKINNIAKAPSPITNATGDPTTFDIDSNWFFENLMFPGATVKINLNGQIDDFADRCRVKRVIIDSTTATAETAWANDILPLRPTYQQLISYLNNNGIAYSEDEETVEFPLVHNNYYGAFQITVDPVIKNGNVWYKLDTVMYHTVTDDGVDNGANITLSIGDVLSYGNTLYKITDMDTATKMVRLTRVSGSENPGIGSILNFYEYPSQAKELSIRFGAHEFNIIYIKAVQEDWNLVADTWSEPFMFSSDELVFTRDNTTTFDMYYANNIIDWGANMIAEAKEHRIMAWYGKKPNAPVLHSEDYRVVQINTQINAALDNTDIKSTADEIVSTKSNINSLKSTIASQKTELQNITNFDEYQALQTQISNNTTELESLQISYSTLVSYLQNLVKENSAVTTAPKYHIRGFFDIPELQYSDDSNIAQEIIGFEIAYRYIKEDETGVALNTYTYTGTAGTTMQGTFSDWNITASRLKERAYNESTGLFEWITENTNTSDTININQIDIPISKGEKVEFKVRAISEAGYPSNCLKSDWSNALVMEFPSNLTTTNELADLIQETNNDNITMTIENTIRSIGVNAHLSDTISNSESITGVYYHHTAKALAYERKNKLNNTVETVSVQDVMDTLMSEYDQMNESYVDLFNRYNKIDSYLYGDVSTVINVNVPTLEYNTSIMYDYLIDTSNALLDVATLCVDLSIICSDTISRVDSSIANITTTINNINTQINTIRSEQQRFVDTQSLLVQDAVNNVDDLSTRLKDLSLVVSFEKLNTSSYIRDISTYFKTMLDDTSTDLNTQIESTSTRLNDIITTKIPTYDTYLTTNNLVIPATPPQIVVYKPIPGTIAGTTTSNMVKLFTLFGHDVYINVITVEIPIQNFPTT